MASLISNLFSRTLPRIKRRSTYHTAQPVLYTERLYLRPFNLSDASRVKDIVNTPLVSEMTASIPYPYPDGLAERWIATHSQGWSQRKFICYAVILREADLLIGSFSLMNIQDGEAELGYWLGMDYWGQGFATEAGMSVQAFAFQTLKCHLLHARHLDRNPASGSVLEKLGFEYVGSQEQKLGIMLTEETMHLYRSYPL